MAKAAPLIAAISLLLADCGSSTPTAPQAGTPSPVGPPTASAVATGSGMATQSVEPSGSGAPGASGVPSASGVPGTIDPSTFVANVENPWFPLKPGTKLTYTGGKDGEKAVDVVEVSGETKVVAGVTCVVVRDRLSLAGTLEERTEDWFAQDRDGNVWYFGEATAELDEAGNVVSTEGSWTAGVDGAAPGIVMPASPQVGQSFQQEFYAGHAEDRFVVLLTTASVKVPAGTYTRALLTAEWTTLEPRVLGQKFYARGIGLVKELDVTGGNESLVLARLQRP
jgi:hypothetical protein